MQGREPLYPCVGKSRLDEHEHEKHDVDDGDPPRHPRRERKPDPEQDRDPDQVPDDEVRAEILQAVEAEHPISRQVELQDGRHDDGPKPAHVNHPQITAPVTPPYTSWGAL